MKIPKILVLTRYDKLGASSRLRSYQYAKFLSESGFDLTFQPFFGNDYVSSLYFGRVSVVGVLRSYWTRLNWMVGFRKFDALWVEKELLPWVPSWIELAFISRHTALVVDYDDAWFHRYDRHRSRWVRALLGNKIDRVMARADLVIAGNDYLAHRAKDAGARGVRLLPTVVDLQRYPPVARDPARSPLVVGWMGSPSTAKYLEPLFPVAEELQSKYPVRFVAVGAKSDQVAGSVFEAMKWSEESESALLSTFDIGIMPLPDEDWERGKCGYKLIQYMASGLPVVASGVGVNTEIVRPGLNGFIADDAPSWTGALAQLLENRLLRSRMGKAGRQIAEAEYCTDIVKPKLAALLRSATEKQR